MGTSRFSIRQIVPKLPSEPMDTQLARKRRHWVATVVLALRLSHIGIGPGKDIPDGDIYRVTGRWESLVVGVKAGKIPFQGLSLCI